MEYVLKQIQLFLRNPEFLKHKHSSFHFIMNKYEPYREEIERLIDPFGGKMSIAPEYVEMKMAPIIDDFLKTVAKKMQQN